MEVERGRSSEVISSGEILMEPRGEKIRDLNRLKSNSGRIYRGLGKIKIKSIHRCFKTASLKILAIQNGTMAFDLED